MKWHHKLTRALLKIVPTAKYSTRKTRKLKPTVLIELPENRQKVAGGKLRLSLEMSHKRLDTTLARHLLEVVAKMKRKY